MNTIIFFNVHFLLTLSVDIFIPLGIVMACIMLAFVYIHISIDCHSICKFVLSSFICK